MKNVFPILFLFLSLTFSANAQALLGQWYSEEEETYLIIETDSLTVIVEVEDENCYEYEQFLYSDSANFIITYVDTETYQTEYELSGDSLYLTDGEGEQSVYGPNNDDVSVFTNCADLYAWACGSQGCYETTPGDGQFLLEEDCAEECTSTSIEDLVITPLRVYPNPMQEYAILEISGNPIRYNVYDTKANLVCSEEITSKLVQLNRGSLNSGVYYLEVVGKYGVTMEKLIVH